MSDREVGGPVAVDESHRHHHGNQREGGRPQDETEIVRLQGDDSDQGKAEADKRNSICHSRESASHALFAQVGGQADRHAHSPRRIARATSPV